MKLLKIWFQKYKRNQQEAITYEELKLKQAKNANILLLDVRSKQEYEEGHLPGSICIPVYELQESMSISKESEIITYCQTDSRSKNATKILKKMGYKNVYYIKGGIESCKEYY